MRSEYISNEYGRFYFNERTGKYDLPSVTTVLAFKFTGKLGGNQFENKHMRLASERGMALDSQVAREVGELEQVTDSFIINQSGNRLRSLPSPVSRTLYHEHSVGLISPTTGIGYKGSLDYCYKDTGGQTILIDFKTYSATKSDRLPKKTRDKYCMQLSAYALALKHTEKVKVDKAYLQVVTFKDWKESETYSDEVNLEHYTPLWIEALQEFWIAYQSFGFAS